MGPLTLLPDGWVHDLDSATSVLKFVAAAGACAWTCYGTWRRLRRRHRRPGRSA